jgi:salicylate hydroxylase
MTPWQGSGAGQAIEDIMILAKLLENTQTPSELNAALQAYDHVRRPRSQRIVESSKVTGLILCGKAHGIELDPEKLSAALAPRWDFIFGLDMKEHQNEAIRVMDSLLEKENK